MRVAFIPMRCIEREHFTDEAFFNLDGTVNNLPDADRARRFEQVVVAKGHRQSHSQELHYGLLAHLQNIGQGVYHIAYTKRWLAQKEPEKKMPSTMAKVMRYSANEACCEFTTFQPILLCTNSGNCFNCIVPFVLLLFVLDIHVGEEGIGINVDVFHHELKAIENCTSSEVTSVMKFWLRLLVSYKQLY
jgi:hypothetical protein